MHDSCFAYPIQPAKTGSSELSVGVRAIRWAIRQLRFEGAIIAGLAR